MESKNYGAPLGQIFGEAKKRWWVILIAAVLCAVLVFMYTYFLVEPMYTSTARIGVRFINMNAYNESITGQKVAKECSDILMSDITLSRATEKLNSAGIERKDMKNPTYTNNMLRSMISTVIDTDSRYFDVKVQSSDPNEAEKICDVVINEFFEVLKEKNLINDAEGILLDYPRVPSKPSSPNIPMNTAVGALLGMVLSFGAFVAIGFLKDSIDGEDWLINTYNDKIPVLAVIPDADSTSNSYRKYSKKYGYNYGYGYHPSDKE